MINQAIMFTLTEDHNDHNDSILDINKAINKVVLVDLDLLLNNDLCKETLLERFKTYGLSYVSMFTNYISAEYNTVIDVPHDSSDFSLMFLRDQIIELVSQPKKKIIKLLSDQIGDIEHYDLVNNAMAVIISCKDQPLSLAGKLIGGFLKHSIPQTDGLSIGELLNNRFILVDNKGALVYVDNTKEGICTYTPLLSFARFGDHAKLIMFTNVSNSNGSKLNLMGDSIMDLSSPYHSNIYFEYYDDHVYYIDASNNVYKFKTSQISVH